jgi:hypothetical protein
MLLHQRPKSESSWQPTDHALKKPGRAEFPTAPQDTQFHHVYWDIKLIQELN